MKINIKDITEEGLDLEFKENPKDLDLKHGQLESLNEVKINVQIQKEDDTRFLVNGKIFASWNLICNRCLKSYNQKFNVQFSREYILGKDEAVDENLKEEKLNTVFFTGEEIDLDEDIRQDLLLAIPLKTLCKDECMGMCSQCGKDLNSGKCSCVQEEIDSRWEKLISVKKKLEKKSNVK